MEILSCGHELIRAPNGWAWNYGYSEAGKKICDACCGQEDLDAMMRKGSGALSFTLYGDAEWRAIKALSPDMAVSSRYRLYAWAGREFVPQNVKAITGMFYGSRSVGYTFWFIGPDGYAWWGRASGTTGYARCRRYKHQRERDAPGYSVSNPHA